MARKNRHLVRGRNTERTFRDLFRFFALDITADRAVPLTGLLHKTTLSLYRPLRLCAENGIHIDGLESV